MIHHVIRQHQYWYQEKSFISSRTLDYGAYIARVTVSMVINETIFGPSDPVAASIDASFVIVTSPLVAVLQDAGNSKPLRECHMNIVRKSM